MTLGLLTGLTFGRNAHTVLSKLIYLIQNKHTLFLPVENSILRRINEFSNKSIPLKDNFEFLAEDDIRMSREHV